MSALPESYTDRTQCCARCVHVFIKYEYEDPPELFCTRGGLPRPESRREMCERLWQSWWETDTSKIDRKWDEWASEREVKPWGRCDHFELAEDADERW